MSKLNWIFGWTIPLSRIGKGDSPHTHCIMFVGISMSLNPLYFIKQKIENPSEHIASLCLTCFRHDVFCNVKGVSKDWLIIRVNMTKHSLTSHVID